MEHVSASAVPVQIRQTGVEVDPTAISGLRAEYEQTGICLLPRFLSPELVGLIMKQLASTDLAMTNEINKHNGSVFGTTRKALLTDPLVTVLHFILNRPELFRLAADVAGIEKPGNFLCRLHRTEVAGEQYIDWHDDEADDSVLGLDINLSDNQFEGGLFQIRDPEKQIRREVHFSDPGDAFIFRIGERWKHKLTPLEKGSRTVAVGWFRSKPAWEMFAPVAFYNSRLLAYEGQVS